MQHFTPEELESLAEELEWTEIIPEGAQLIDSATLKDGSPAHRWKIAFGVDEVTFATSPNHPGLREFRPDGEVKWWSRFDALRHLRFGGDRAKTIDFLMSRFDIERVSLASIGRQLQGERLRDSLECPPHERGRFDPYFLDLVARKQYEMEAGQLAKEQARSAQLDRDTQPPEAVNLDEFLTETSQPLEFLIDALAIKGGTIVPFAQAKVGKTTLTMNLQRSLADHEPFLNYFPVAEHPGRIGFFNYELTEDQCRKWFSDISIENASKIVVWNLRGRANPFMDRDAMMRFAEREVAPQRIETAVLDPLSGAFMGNTMDNDEVKRFFLMMEEFKTLAGIATLFVVVHAGKDESRPRGATTLRDHPDALWSLSKNSSGHRYFKAEGRDVDLDEGELLYDPTTRLLTFIPASKRAFTPDAMKQTLLDYIRDNPGCKAGAVDLAVKGSKERKASLRGELLREGLIEVRVGARNSKLFYPTSLPVFPESDSESGGLEVSSRSPLPIGGTTTGGTTDSEYSFEGSFSPWETETSNPEVPEIDWGQLLQSLPA